MKGEKMAMIEIGSLLREGKTKQVYEVKNEPTTALLVAKNDITAGDGAKHDIMEGKAAYATTTTCNVFLLIKKHTSVPVAFEEQFDAVSFKARRCEMLPLEVVIRREAHGSYLKRHPDVKKGTRFDDLVCEFFLKTSGRKYKGYDLQVDDPLLAYNPLCGNVAHIYHPARSSCAEDSFLRTIPFHEIISFEDPVMLLLKMQRYAFETFLALEAAWQKLGGKLVDFKVEFGVDEEGELLLADVIDNDSWRVIINDEYKDKQQYRDGKDLKTVAENYKQIAEFTNQFS